MSDLVPCKRALISVHDKTGLEAFAAALHGEFGIELISTGGTARFLREHGLPVMDVSEATGFPEMMDGRVKTLHPKIHGGLLALRDHDDHVASMKAHGITPIDLVCINLYPFEATIARPGVSFEEAIEQIDIGGPSMIRSAAKNHRFVLVVTHADRYEKVLGDLREHGGSTCGNHRRKMAQRAFAVTAKYDAAIAGWLEKQLGSAVGSASADAGLPQSLTLNLNKKQDLRYGENPHQKAALYTDSALPSVANAIQLHGKELSYINLLDADAAVAAVGELDLPGACIVKHATPCGFAGADDLAVAFAHAYAGDPLAAFGGIVALNRNVDLDAAQAITGGQLFLEVIVAPSYDTDALELLKSRWKNVRLLSVASNQKPVTSNLNMHRISGGFLVQQSDNLGLNESDWKVVSKRAPTESELADLRIAWLACKHVKSNAITLARGRATVGIGGGQVDRVGACGIAISKAGDRARGSAAASDAFFPFPDGPQLLLDAGVAAIIHPGGSVRDGESLAAVDKAGAAMVLTGTRHFRH